MARKTSFENPFWPTYADRKDARHVMHVAAGCAAFIALVTGG
jgi:hypothetical protein